jgi:hypothetical protein
MENRSQGPGDGTRRKRPGIGDAREVRQPLNIDRLPEEAREAIQALRNGYGKTWQEIAEQSARPYSANWKSDNGGFVNWDALETPVLELFPEMRLSRTSLNRWFDLRIDQVRTEVLAESAASRAFAEKFAGVTVAGGNELIINAMRDEVFAMMRSLDAGSRVGFLKGLNGLSLAVSRIERLELSKRRVEAEIARSETERAKIAAQSGDPREVYMQAITDLLKKLRTRVEVRAVLDPIKDELIQEMSHGAEAFAKQIEASAA